MFSKKKTECRVCGYRFTPERENIYTAEEPRSALEMLTAAPTRFSAVDCPICGCQIRLADRAPRIDLPAITEQHDADAEETDGLSQSWDRGGAVFCNPPYGREIGKWVQKAFEEARGGIRLFYLSQRGRTRHIFTITFTGKRKSASCAGGYGSRTATGTPPIPRPSRQW